MDFGCADTPSWRPAGLERLAQPQIATIPSPRWEARRSGIQTVESSVSTETNYIALVSSAAAAATYTLHVMSYVGLSCETTPEARYHGCGLQSASAPPAMKLQLRLV
jgi:hypothetical protein